MKGVQLEILKGVSETEIDAAFAYLVQRHAGALMVSADPAFGLRNDQIMVLASRHAIPAIYNNREDVARGGLVSYGSSIVPVESI